MNNNSNSEEKSLSNIEDRIKDYLYYSFIMFPENEKDIQRIEDEMDKGQITLPKELLNPDDILNKMRPIRKTQDLKDDQNYEFSLAARKLSSPITEDILKKMDEDRKKHNKENKSPDAP